MVHGHDACLCFSSSRPVVIPFLSCNYTAAAVSLFFSDKYTAAVSLFFSLAQPEDLYYPHPLIQDILWATLDKFLDPILIRWSRKRLREKALRTVMEYIRYEDENHFICIRPINKGIHCYN